MIIYASRGEAFEIDESDYHLIKNYNWYLNERYIKAKIDGQLIYLHVFLNSPAPVGFVWDHKDRNRMNNKRDNLRLATYHESALNRSKETAESTFQGIYKRKTSKGIRWETYSIDNPRGITMYLGICDSIEDAIYKQELARLGFKIDKSNTLQSLI